jgi:predicted nucleic acid-binding protein
VIVVDASVLATALADDGADGQLARDHLAGQHLIAPELIDLEVLSVWRRTLTDPRRADLAITDLHQIRLTRVPHHSLIDRCWQLRHNLTTYDAAYVAVAEVFNATLLTADLRLSRATGPRCAIATIP